MRLELIDIALEILEEKKECFLEYEVLTQSMLSSNIVDLPPLFDKRQKLIERLDQLDQNIQKIAKSNAKYKLLSAAVRNSCNRADLPKQLQIIFDRSQEIYTIINRLNQHEAGIKRRLDENQTELLERIKAGHHTSKILKYRHGIYPKLSEGSLLNINNRNA